MNNKELITSFTEFVGEKNIDRPTLTRMLEEMLRTLIQKKFNVDSNFHIIINPNKGDLEIMRYRVIVPDDDPSVDDFDKIGLSAAQKIEPDFQVGEEVGEAIDLSLFSRREITRGLKIFLQKEEMERREKLFDRYQKLVGRVLLAQVYHVAPYRIIFHDDQKNELYLNRANQIPTDRFKKGDFVDVLVEKVEKNDRGVYIGITRTSPQFLEELLEQEIPEIPNIVKIKKIARIPGVRAKVAVYSEDDRVDPVGACLGNGGNRLYKLSKESLGFEHINVIHYTPNDAIFIRRLLSPAEIDEIKDYGDEVVVKMKSDQVPLAIGKRGQNIQLASQLLGRPIHIDRDGSLKEKREDIANLHQQGIAQEVIDQLKKANIDTLKGLSKIPKALVLKKTGLSADALEQIYQLIQREEDINLEEFSDEVSLETIEKLKKIGLHTGKDFLRKSRDYLIKKASLTEKEVDMLHDVIKKEFTS